MLRTGKAVVKACDGIGYGAYHFSSGKDVSVIELYDAVVKAMGFNDYPEPEIRELAPDDVFNIVRSFKTSRILVKLILKLLPKL